MTETPDKLPRILEPETKSWIERKAQGAPPYNRCDIKANDLLVAIDYIAAQAEKIEKLEADLTWIYDNADNEGVEVGSVCSCSLISQIKERAQTALKEADSQTPDLEERV